MPHRGADAALFVKSFGMSDIRLRGEPILRWPAGRSRILFQYLMIHINQRVTSDRLYEALWPDTVRSSGTSSLKVACHGLRRTLGAARDGSADIRLLYRDFGYMLEADDVWFDVTEFERLVDSGLRAKKTGHARIARADLEAAMRLYDGDFLEGDMTDWVIAHREYLKSLALCALQELRDIAERDADIAEVISLCVRTIDLDRFHEASYRKLVALHGQRGELERAHSWFRLCVVRLREHLGVAPAPETLAVFRRTLAPCADAQPVRRTG
ncbi:BTAD domain-containing putative transcriptional regulator [Nocardia sp. NPDC052566]|uniref:AfsR/SARP family transcriptional regulator n=1 Tax=Nocardia sp. NPDC052566 TaxID=3364330 RepID=UPI0037C519A1